MKIGQYKLVQTCNHCPEQYEVYDEHGALVGLLSYRWDRFTAYVYSNSSSLRKENVYLEDSPLWHNEYFKMASIYKAIAAINTWILKDVNIIYVDFEKKQL